MSPRPLVFCSFIAVAACGVGDVTNVRTDGDVDASIGNPDPTADAAPLECAEPVANVGSGEHNAGQACVACHADEGGPDFTLAGTLYGDAAGTTPLAGATVVVTDAAGASLELVTQRNGNFWTTQPVVFPVHVGASRCPDASAMAATVATADCNAAGCHAAGSATGRIHLP